jgi:hypothetical protein
VVANGADSLAARRPVGVLPTEDARLQRPPAGPALRSSEETSNDWVNAGLCWLRTPFDRGGSDQESSTQRRCGQTYIWADAHDIL